MKIFTPLLSNLLSFFYPKTCPLCTTALQQFEKSVCTECMIHLPETGYHLQHENPLTLLFRGRVPVEHVSALLFYKKGNQVQHLLHNFKYKGQKTIGEDMGYYFGKQLINSPLYRTIDCIIPIPLHPKKLRIRGYNQSEYFAKGLSKGLNIPYYSTILIKDSYTETQTRKSKFSRWENVKDSFQIANVSFLQGKNILLCDDVLTTGATVEAAIEQLIRCEGVKVHVATLATAY